VPKIEKTKNGARHTAHGKEYFEPQTHADGRRLFARPTWPAKNPMPSGQVRWAALGEVPRKVRFVFIAQRLQVSSEQVVRMKDPCSGMRKHSAAVCAGLRMSAVKRAVWHFYILPCAVRPAPYAIFQ
jgi:hypothetical protein